MGKWVCLKAGNGNAKGREEKKKKGFRKNPFGSLLLNCL